ncbi:hypothetical protein E2562_010840 [Oryza meyeriana var. granulata]|uniref:Uncharacterized protein n=1 Tax=Oryza meyeriana var. granulata TaxID=110450 RepID=A0A6G1BJW2_9ORYZ|nr:hypothetical protein E2562_010840 [Oryza meyeriana var. granulata]
MGSGQPVGASLLRTNSSLLGAVQPAMGMGAGMGMGMGGGGGGLPSQSPFSSLVSRTQYGGNGLLAGASNVASLLSRPSFGNGGVGPSPGTMQGGGLGQGTMQGGGLPMGTLQQRGGVDIVGDLDNNIEYWRNFVNEYFAPSAKKRWMFGIVRYAIESQDEALVGIASWEFCARRHEELIPRRSIIPQIAEVVNCMKDLIDYSRQNESGPIGN